MSFLQVAGFLDNSAVNGVGLRSVVFLSGCYHNCYKCHNKDMQDPSYGELVSITNIYNRIYGNLPLISGVTISGGEPFYQFRELLELLKILKLNNINCWVYTGYTYTRLLDNKNYRKLLPFIDVLVEGPFIHTLANTELMYIGSTNQRILELEDGKIKDILTF